MSACVVDAPTVWTILTYDGASLDISINYATTAVILCAAVAAMLRRPSGRQYALVGASIALSAVIAFQLGLCVCLGCTGISVVWNAAVGYMLITDVLQGAPDRRMLLAAMLVCALVDVYYLATAEPLTTIAHGCALLLGTALGGIYVCSASGLRSRQRAWTRLSDADGASGPSSYFALAPFTRSQAPSAPPAAPPSRPAGIDARLLQLLRNLTARTPPVALEPLGFFVAWHGVLVLAWRGFPAPLSDLKSRIEQAAMASDGAAAAGPGVQLKAEGAGSKWPKISLAVVRDAAPPLSASQLRALKRICRSHTAALCPPSRPNGQAVPTWPIDALSAVVYSWRSLEQFHFIADLSLGQDVAPEGGAAAVRVVAVRAADAARVAAVMCEWDAEEEYLLHVNKPGSRLRSYRQDSPWGAMLVAFLAPRQPAAAGSGGVSGGAGGNRAGNDGNVDSAILPALREFRAAVDAALPGVYSWFDERSSHCTVRSLDEEPR